MNSQKVENQLNLALDTPVAVRAKTDNLNVGYIPEEEAWELIVRYEGDLGRVRSLGATVTELINNYAIIVAPERIIDTLANLEEIIYIEKPKRLFCNRERKESFLHRQCARGSFLFGWKYRTVAFELDR